MPLSGRLYLFAVKSKRKDLWLTLIFFDWRQVMVYGLYLSVYLFMVGIAIPRIIAG